MVDHVLKIPGMERTGAADSVRDSSGNTSTCIVVEGLQLGEWSNGQKWVLSDSPG